MKKFEQTEDVSDMSPIYRNFVTNIKSNFWILNGKYYFDSNIARWP